MLAWFDRAFGPWYLELYPHRDRAEAERALRMLTPWLPARGLILDVGCGPGRHLRLLREAGYRVAGLDRSAALLAEAARTEAAPGRLLRGDMRRLPLAAGACAAVLTMFTSFGYFETRRAHRDLLTEYARVTAKGGVLILDYLNAPAVRAALVPVGRREVRGHEVRETRTIVAGRDGDHVVKNLEICDPEGRMVERYTERVALYDRAEMLELLEASGWSEPVSLGDYDGGDWTPEAPRLILTARRAGR